MERPKILNPWRLRKMSKKLNLNPLTGAIGAALAVSALASSPVMADTNPFAVNELDSGYMVLAMAEGKCGEGKCGEGKAEKAEGKCGEGKCGESK